MKTVNEILKDQNLTKEDLFKEGFEEKMEKFGKDCMIEAVWECVHEANRMYNANNYDGYKLAWDIINQIDPTRKKINV